MGIAKKILMSLSAAMLISTSLIGQETKPAENMNFAEYKEIQHVENSEEHAINPDRSSHKGARHYLVFVNPIGEQIQLEDGSLWNVREQHVYVANHWQPGHKIVILPLDYWSYWKYSNNKFYFTFYNATLQEYADVEPFTGPAYDNPYRRFIVGFDFYGDRPQLILDDHSRWVLSGQNRHLWQHWEIGNTVIIGHSNGSWWSDPNILINFDCGVEFFESRSLN